MKIIKDKDLEKIYGGTTNYITSTFINTILNVVNVIGEGGVRIGSAIRRISEGNLCPLD